MQPNKKKNVSLSYAIVLIVISVLSTSAIANTKVYEFISEVVSITKNDSSTDSSNEISKDSHDLSLQKEATVNNNVVDASTAMFMTIIQGADNTEGCSANGFTVARFNLCGDFDDRIISLSGGPYSSVSWQVLDSCTPDIDENCPNTNTGTGGCYSEVSTGPTFNLDASAVDASLGAEFVVIADGQPFYFKARKNNIILDSESRDFLCGTPGRIQLLGLPSGYEYTIDGGATWQTSVVFNNLTPGDYNVITRLENTPGACEYPYETITIEERDIEIGVTVTDVLCVGENGTIQIDVLNGIPGPYNYRILDETGIITIQEAIGQLSNTINFTDIAFGTYQVEVSTPQCAGNAALGISPPRQNLDVLGNPIAIGEDVTAIEATAEHTQSLSAACGVNSVDINLGVSGGLGPYTYTVNGDPTVHGPIAGTDTFTVTTADTYEFTFFDANGCEVTISDPVAAITPPEVTVSGVDGTCTNGGARLEFNVIDAKGYTLSFRADSADPWSTSTSLSVAAGTYDDIQVRYQLSANDCILQLTPPQPNITVSNDDGVDAVSAKLTDETCSLGGGTTGGSIEINSPTGGSGSYEYSIDGVNFSGTNTFTGLPSGAYTPYIRDTANPACVRELTEQTINEADPPTDLDFTLSDIDCAAGTVSVTLSATANFTISSYEIISPTATTGGPTFAGLTSGTNYTFRVTDVNNCVYEESYVPVVESTFRARVSSNGDRRVCSTATDGSGAFLIDGFFPDTPGSDYDYVVNYTPISGTSSVFQTGSSSDLSLNITGLGAGTYDIVVTDNDTNCIANASFDVETATLSLNGDVTEMSCQNDNRGRVEALATGGFGGNRYELEWPGGATQGPKSGRFFGNLTEEGEYILTVTDVEGCTAEHRFMLTEVNAPEINLGASDLCFSATNDASISVTSTVGSGDIGDHQFRINNGPLQTPGTPGAFIFNNLVPGTYTIEVVNVTTNCSAELPVVVVPRQVRVNLGLTTEIGCDADGEMRIRVLDGDISDLSMVSYDIMYDDGTTTTSVESGTGLPSNPYDFPVTGAGSYTVTVFDNNGCPNTSEALIFDPPTMIAATHRIVGPSCLDPNSGFVEIIPTVSSGVPPFEIVFAPAPTPGVLDDNPNNPNAGSTTFSFSDQTIYSGLAAGFYEYVVKDARNCVTAVTRIEVVDDPTPAPDATISTIDATCNPSGEVFGGIRIDGVTSGVPEYTYIIENLLGNEITRITTDAATTYPIVISDPTIIPGDYRIITLDSRGCRDTDDVTVNTSTVNIVPDVSSLPLVCTPGGFTYCVDIVGGVGLFDIRLVEDPAGAFIALGGTPGSPVRNYCFPNVQFGESFTVEVRDNDTGCIYEEVITVPDEPSGTLDVDLTIDNGTCIPGNLVDLTYTITGATGNLDIEIRNLETNDVVISETRTDATFTYQVLEGEYSILIVDDGTECSGGDTAVATLNIPRVDVIENISANCNALGQLTVRGSGGAPYPETGPNSLPDGSLYEYAFVEAGTTPTNANFSTATTVALDGDAAPGRNYDIWVRDSRNCEFMTSAAVVQLDPDLPIPAINVNNQCDVTTPSGGFTITVEMLASVDTPTFTLNGVTQTPVYDSNVPTQATFSVNNIGEYPVHVIDANGCDVDALAEVFQVLSASGDFTTDPTCTDLDGTITINADGGSGDFTFELQDNSGTPIGASNNTGIFTGVAPGEYQVEVTDNIVTDGTDNCAFLVENIIRSIPVTPEIVDIGKSDISCHDLDNGSISMVLTTGTDIDGIREYNLYRYSGTLPLPVTETPITTNTTGSFDSLDGDIYVVEVVSDRGCIDQEQFEIVNPPEFQISWPEVSFACVTGANRFSIATIMTTIESVGNGGPYSYRLDPTDSYQTNGIFNIVDNGTVQTITVFAIDSNGCESQFTRDIPLPTDVGGAITQVNAMNCEDPERIRIEVNGTTDFTIEDQGTSIAFVPDNVVSGVNFVEFDLPMEAGEYRLQINDNGGCTYPIAPYTVVDPTPPTVVLSEAQRVTCSTLTTPGSDGELFIEVSDYVTPGAYEYQLYSVNGAGVETAIGTPVALNTGTNPERITGLSGGNYRVAITTTDGAMCPALSNVATIRTPIPLTVTATSLQEAGCSDDFGQIEASGFGGWTTATTPYEYQLRVDDGSGTYPTIEVPYTTNGLFENLSSGDYRVEIRDEEGCPAIYDISVAETLEIQAEIREPANLICPGDNNAILEVYDPRTGDALTATTGVSGGVPGAGYKLRLLYLNSDDVDADGNPTDIRETGGYQDPFVFEGNSGGTIGAGWYAIEVESGFGCIHITAPYEVIAPPPLIANLNLVQVPGCGGDGIMRLSVENGDMDPSVVYEFRRDDLIEPWQDMDEDGNTAITLSRPADVNAYVYLVREKGGVCDPVLSSGINLRDATTVTLSVGTPDDISCASELDGRIEYSAIQGLGVYEFILYRGDPGTDPYNPNASATVIQTSIEIGAFENLGPATDYYITVTSGTADCSDFDGPFTIMRPDPIEVMADPVDVSCNDDEDGSIRMEVTSGGEGLLEFAIAPNFNEFFSDPSTPGIYVFEDLPAGTYDVLVKDDRCTEIRTVEVLEPDPLMITNLETTPELCIGANNGTVVFDIEGGTPFNDLSVSPLPYYEYRIEMTSPIVEDITGGFIPYDGSVTENLQGGGTYVIFVQDANGCDTNDLFSIDIGVDLSAEPIVQYGCEGIFPNSTASVAITDESLLPDLLFFLEDMNAVEPALTDREMIDLASSQHEWGDLPASQYMVHIFHENGCSMNVQFEVDAYEPLILEAIKTSPNELTAFAEGGYGGYEFFFQGESTGEETVFTTNENTMVNVRVVDARGCEAFVNIPFEFTGMIEIPNFFTPDGDNLNDEWAPNNREFFPNIDVKIYDRYGRVVAELNQVTSWDGKYEGNELPTGDYWYVVNANDKSKQRYVGHFTLYR